MLVAFAPSFLLYIESIVLCLKIFCTYTFDDLADCQNMLSCGSISLKTVLIFHKNFLNFRFDRIEKQCFINFSSYSNSYTFVVLCDSDSNHMTPKKNV